MYAQGTSIFNVGSASALSALATTAGSIPGGAALVTDPGSPQGNYTFTGPGVHSYVTRVLCDAGTSASGAISSTATLTGSNGQQITQSATVQKQCYDLQVDVASRSTPRIGRWSWSVRKSSSPGTLTLRPAQGTSPSSDRMLSFSRDYAATNSGEVMYSVTFTRSAPTAKSGTAVAADAAFEATGDIDIRNPAPINARLQSVIITVSSSSGGQPYITQATCPSLVVPAGQRMTCTWRATPTFNPLGQQIRATARLINTHNGQSSASTSDFSSAPTTIGGGDASEVPDASADEDAAAAGASRRRLQQTWGGGARSHGAYPDMFTAAAADVGNVFDLNGAPLVVPGSVSTGNGVIVSGNALVSGAVTTPVAMSASGSAPVILPSPLRSANSGLFVNEAGPGSRGSLLTGLQDECVDVGDVFTQGDGMVAGTLVSGSPPSGRICSTSTFTYTLRYGPYNDCAPRKSVNVATFQTSDTLTRGSSQSETYIILEGCGSPAALRVTPVKAITSAKGGYSWAVNTQADTEELAVPQGATGEVTYTVDVKRTGSKSGATLTADVFVVNPTSYPIVLEAVTYTATTMCDGFPKTTSGRVLCDGSAVPARGRIPCRAAGSVPCAGNGAYTLVLTTAGGLTVTGNPTPFAFNMKQLGASNVAAACADVAELLGADGINGTLVSGQAPSGKICSSQAFKYTVKYGPFNKCGPVKVRGKGRVRGGAWEAAEAASAGCWRGCQKLPGQTEHATKSPCSTRTPSKPPTPTPAGQQRLCAVCRRLPGGVCVHDAAHPGDGLQPLQRPLPRRGLRADRGVVGHLQHRRRQQVRQRVEAPARGPRQGDTVLPQGHGALHPDLRLGAVPHGRAAHRVARRVRRGGARVCGCGAQLPQRRAPPRPGPAGRVRPPAGPDDQRRRGRQHDARAGRGGARGCGAAGALQQRPARERGRAGHLHLRGPVQPRRPLPGILCAFNARNGNEPCRLLACLLGSHTCHHPPLGRPKRLNLTSFTLGPSG